MTDEQHSRTAKRLEAFPDSLLALVELSFDNKDGSTLIPVNARAQATRLAAGLNSLRRSMRVYGHELLPKIERLMFSAQSDSASGKWWVDITVKDKDLDQLLEQVPDLEEYLNKHKQKKKLELHESMIEDTSNIVEHTAIMEYLEETEEDKE